jgi:hypothetical protein
MKKFQRFYVKFLIKNPLIFYTFLGVVVLVFVWMSLTTRVNVMHSFPANIQGNTMVIQEIESETLSSETLYYYTNRNEKIYQTRVSGLTETETGLVIEMSEANLSGDVTADLVVGSETLLERIFVKAGVN